jgi:hypothetical protein
MHPFDVVHHPVELAPPFIELQGAILKHLFQAIRIVEKRWIPSKTTDLKIASFISPMLFIIRMTKL